MIADLKWLSPQFLQKYLPIIEAAIRQPITLLFSSQTNEGFINEDIIMYTTTIDDRGCYFANRNDTSNHLLIHHVNNIQPRQSFSSDKYFNGPLDSYNLDYVIRTFR